MKSLPLYNPHFENLYRDFEKAVKGQGYSGGSNKDCTFHYLVREFLFFLESKAISSITEVKASQVIAYYEYLRERPNQRREGGLSDCMLRKQLYCLRLFFDFLMDTGVIVSSPVHLPKFERLKYNRREPLSVDEVKLLYAAARQKTDRAILALAYGCGLRRGEIVQLNLQDIQLHSGILTVRKGKFGKTRTIPVADAALKDLKEYIIYERSGLLAGMSNPAMLVNRQGMRLGPQSIYLHLKKLVHSTGNQPLIRKNISVHHLRHSIATHLLDQGADIDFVRNFLGHVFLDTTHLYSSRRKKRKLLQQAAEQYVRTKTANR